MPAVFLSTSFMVSRLRSSISFSVTTVTDCATSRSSCVPLPIVVVTARTLVLPPSSASFLPLTVILRSVETSATGSGAAGMAVWAWARPAMPKPAASAPRGKAVASRRRPCGAEDETDGVEQRDMADGSRKFGGGLKGGAVPGVCWGHCF